MIIRSPGPADIDAAAARLRAGELVAFPTETVYGLGADARSETAVARVFAAKGRPADNPLIVHVASADELGSACREIPEEALRLARAFWPGPLTLVLPALDAIAPATRGLGTVAVRVPDHPVALALLRAAAIPVAAPSANVSGRPSATRAEHVASDFGDAVAVVLDGGPCRVGLESTVLDLSGDVPAILRPGVVTAAAIEAVLGRPLAAVPPAEALARSPGTRHRHYAPRARLLIVHPGVSAAGARALAARLPPFGYLGVRPELRAAAAHAPRVLDLASELHARLRELDALGVEAIVVDAPDEAGAGAAILDRLRRAASEEVRDDASAARA